MSLITLTYILKFIIFSTILNVWLFRKNLSTPFRGGEAKTLFEEFSVYNLPAWSFYLIGTLKVLTASLIFLSIWLKSFEEIAILTLIVIMFGSLIMHIKIKDPIKKSVPALAVLTILILLYNMI